MTKLQLGIKPRRQVPDDFPIQAWPVEEVPRYLEKFYDKSAGKPDWFFLLPPGEEGIGFLNVLQGCYKRTDHALDHGWKLVILYL